MSREYRTASGTYLEEELSIVIWTNPKNAVTRKPRSLETITSENSRYPMAFPTKMLMSNKDWRNATLVEKASTVYDVIKKATRTEPLILPLPVARQSLGFENFYIPNEYEEQS